MSDGSTTTHLYQPKLLATLREGYALAHLRKDAFAGLTVAIVALPLSMAIAVASGVAPERGIFAAIIGGVLVSALGGSRFQIGGPAGAFIVLVAAATIKLGVEGLLLAVSVSGLLLTLIGILRIGSLIRFVPHAVTVGFTCGIAITIFASQLKELGGLTLVDAEPGPLLAKLGALFHALSSFNPFAVILSCSTVIVILVIRHWRSSWPGMLLAVIFASGLGMLFHLPVDTIGSRFGELPRHLPWPRVPALSLALLWQVLPTALSFTLLGAVESLLSAKVADSMTGRKHRSNMELVAQGIANMGSALFGGISVTGTIARTATNIRAGAHGPFAGIFHAIFLLLFLLVAAPLAQFVPLATLAGVLVVVCWNMAERAEFVRLLFDRREAAVLLSTFLPTLLWGLMAGIATGCLVAALLAVLGNRVQSEGR